MEVFENIIKLCEENSNMRVLFACPSIIEKELIKSRLMFSSTSVILDRDGWDLTSGVVWRKDSSTIRFISLSTPGATAGLDISVLYIDKDCLDYMYVGLSAKVRAKSVLRFSCNIFGEIKILGPVK